MGQRGPVPKRSSERRRRNKDSKTQKVRARAKAPVERPAKSARKAAWVAYATTQGIANAGQLTKPELVARLDEPAAASSAHPPAKHWHPIARDWFTSLSESGQSQFYEPSDWAAARYVAEILSKHVKAAKPSAQMFAGIWSAMSDLLSTEAARRRVRMEIEREPEDAGAAAKVTALDDYRQALGA